LADAQRAITIVTLHSFGKDEQGFIRICCIGRAALVAENLALRQQLAVFK